MTDRIRWVDSAYGSTSVSLPYGEVDGVRLFSLSWASRNDDLPYVIRTELPGVSIRSTADPDEARARCERVLAKWLHRMLSARATSTEDCFCGQPDDRDRVHRSHACAPWSSPGGTA